MAQLDNYGKLKAAILNWVNRTNHAAAVAAVPDWVALAEADIRSDISTKNVTRNAALVIGTAEVTLPTDVGKPTDLVLTESQYAGPVEVVSAGRLFDIAGYAADQGRPRAVAIVNGKLLVKPTPDRNYTATLIYEPTLTALSTDADTNWVLQNHPNVYLYGALKHSGAWLKDDERIATWEKLYDDHVARLAKEKADYEFGPGQLVARPALPIG